ncbi:MAG TPA: hypothetical protein VMT17_08750 [Anaeromyxobacteraceae bacterium]|nr:hypothetical protein [Anaeromyxobacteraceae bacterium]
MRKLLLVSFVSCLLAGTAMAAPVHDWKDLQDVHAKVQKCIKEMERARAANHYDMAGHGAKAEDLLRQVERELHMAIEAAKNAK